MARFGKTWWGQQWLNALNHIDYSNRLPRGSAYANRGAVLSINIDKNRIEAKVQGSRRTPYKISITSPVFGKWQQDELINEIAENKFLLSKLLNRELPNELLNIAERKRISLFPSSWRDLNMDCSCPDWAVPCKHLAAVVYIIANEIDNNPFLVFELHGFDILESLKKRGLDAKKHAVESILSLSELLIAKVDDHVEDTKSDELELNYALIPDLSNTITKLLSPSPLFYEYDFREVLEKAIRSLARFAKRYSIGEADRIVKIPRGSGVKLQFNHLLNLSKIHISNHIENQFESNELDNLLKDIGTISQLNELHLYDKSIQLLWETHCFCQMLCSQSAIVPQLLKVEANTYRIRWIPALLHPAINQQFNILAKELASIQIARIEHNQKGKDKSQLKPNEELNTLCSTIINLWYNKYIEPSKLGVKSYGWQFDSIQRLFFLGHPISFSSKEDAIPNAIELWLKRLFIGDKPAVPILRIDETGFGFSIHIDVEVKKNGISEVETLSNFLKNQQYNELSLSLLKDLAQLTDYLPALKMAIDGKGNEITFSTTDFAGILIDVLPIIQLLGITVALPSGLKHLVRPTVGINVDAKAKTADQSFTSLMEMLDYQWGVAVGDSTISPNEFFDLVEGKTGIVKLRNQYLLVSEEELEKLRKQILSNSKLTPMDLLRASLAGEHNDSPVMISEQLQELLKRSFTPETIDLPISIKATMRPYQLVGFQWIANNSRLGFGSLIADDMGLGKTLQVIAVLQYFKDNALINKKQKALVIAPTTLLTNWQKEVDKFAPGLKVAIYHGANRMLPQEEFDVLLTSYGLARNDTAILEKQKWYALVIDESQNIKNPSTAQTKAVKKLKAEIRIAMSGTPVENRLSDYWSVLDFINKGYLGNLKSFQERFAIPIQKWHDQQRTEVFRRVTRPFLLRRLKTDKLIIDDLPDKIENTLYCNLTHEQAAIYQSVVNTTMKDIESNEGIARRGLVLKLITALKQICNHPVHYLKKGKHDIDLSGKTQLLTSILENTISSGEKTLIFTQYKEMGELLVKMLNEKFGFAPLFLHGGLTRKVRDGLVEDFNTKQQHSIFILSLKAGGTGLNLTSASNVVHYDLWWNPAVEAQATDRAYRIGQTKNVMVYRPLCKGTFEEKIDELLKSKKYLADITVESGETWIGNLSNEELRELVILTE